MDQKKKKRISENSETKPLNNYAYGKLIQENIVKKYCKKNRVEYCILRLPGVYGKRDKNTSVVSKIFNSSRKKILIYMVQVMKKRLFIY